jgi:hypothetical protein
VTSVYVGNYYEVAGSTVKKYYYAGNQRVAMKSGTTLYWLLADHLGGTAITVSGTTETGEVHYTAWGANHYTSGTTPTSFKYTLALSLPKGANARRAESGCTTMARTGCSRSGRKAPSGVGALCREPIGHGYDCATCPRSDRRRPPEAGNQIIRHAVDWVKTCSKPPCATTAPRS